jgi:hypothetical protein
VETNVCSVTLVVEFNGKCRALHRGRLRQFWLGTNADHSGWWRNIAFVIKCDYIDWGTQGGGEGVIVQQWGEVTFRKIGLSCGEKE